MVVQSLFLIGLYVFATAFFKQRSIRVDPEWMPHGAVTREGRTMVVFATWALPGLIAAALISASIQPDVGWALLSLLSLGLVGGLVFGLVASLRNATPAAPESAPETAFVPPPRSVRLVVSSQPIPLGAQSLGKGIHLDVGPVEPAEIAHHLPQDLADRLVAELARLRTRTEQAVASSAVLQTEADQMRDRIAELEKLRGENEQALAELGRANQALRGKAGGNEKPFPQMNADEIEKARDLREREIRILDELRRTRSMPRPAAA